MADHKYRTYRQDEHQNLVCPHCAEKTNPAYAVTPLCICWKCGQPMWINGAAHFAEIRIVVLEQITNIAKAEFNEWLAEAKIT